MTATQTAINEAATRWLADLLEHPVTDPTAAASRIVRELLARGVAPVPQPVPLRNTGPLATEQTIAQAKAAVAEAVRAAKMSGGRA